LSNSTNVDRRIPGGYTGDIGEIQSLPAQTPIQPLGREQLRPEEEAVSLPQQQTRAPSTIAPLNQFLGAALTTANPVWSGDPIPRMRGLQKVLVEHSLTLEQSDRSESMAAIQVVETAVKLRLRFQQMHMNEGDMETTRPEGEQEQ
jgi:hypothetical protein